MIAKKIIPCFNFYKIEGDAISKLMGDGNNLLMVSAITHSFDNDVEAFQSAKRVIEKLSEGISVSLSEQFNPDFYPSLPSLKSETAVDPESLDMSETVEELNSQLKSQNKFIIPISRKFDELGDHVQSKIKASDKNFSIVAKIVSNQEKYLQEKTMELFHTPSLIQQDSNQPISLH